MQSHAPHDHRPLQRPRHPFAKRPREEARLLAGLGVEGDAHAGRTVQHLSRIARDPSLPNLRQVHLIHAELFEELAGVSPPHRGGVGGGGFSITPGQLGENVTTCGIDLLGLSRGTRLRLGSEAVIEITGLRNPCHQLNGVAPGLMAAVLARAPDGTLVRKCGVMAVVVTGGAVQEGDGVLVEWEPEAFAGLGVV